MVTRQLRKMWAKLSGSAPGTPLILQKVHAALCNPSIACSLSLVSNWLFLSLKMKSFISLCIKDIFHEFRHIRVVSTFGRFVPVILEKVFVILNVFGSADLICELHRTFRNFLDPFWHYLGNPVGCKWSGRSRQVSLSGCGCWLLQAAAASIRQGWAGDPP